MRAHLIELLRRLELKVPPPPRCHHVITFAQYGSDEGGWQDQLAIQINRAGVFHCFFIDEGDLEGPLEVFVETIASLLDKQMPNAQLGIGPGQYPQKGK